MITAAFVILMLAAGGFVIRLIIGPSLADRIIGVDGLLAVGCGAIALEALKTGDGQFLPVIVVVTLIGFVSTSVAARFIEAQDTLDPTDNGAVGAAANGDGGDNATSDASADDSEAAP